MQQIPATNEYRNCFVAPEGYVFVISHKGDQLFDKFRSVIKFEKKGNFSRIAK